eukprot:8870693-Pyramimonas_sp.AAC.1
MSMAHDSGIYFGLLATLLQLAFAVQEVGLQDQHRDLELPPCLVPAEPEVAQDLAADQVAVVVGSQVVEAVVVQ